jgi:hypothetical protein
MLSASARVRAASNAAPIGSNVGGARLNAERDSSAIQQPELQPA